MSVQEVLRMGHPILHQIARPVGDANTAEIQQLIHDLRDTMRARNGAGLAAPQIGQSVQVVIYGTGLPNPRYPGAPIIAETVLINPSLEPIGTEVESGWEGCLSCSRIERGSEALEAVTHSGIGQQRPRV